MKKLIALGLSLFLLLSLFTACEQKDKNETSPTTTEGKEKQDSAAIAPELEPQEESLAGCFITPERTKYPKEDAVPKEAKDITVDDRAGGYRVNYEMGYSLYLPKAWQELEAISVMVDDFGDSVFENEPIYAAKAFYYMTPGIALAFDDYYRSDMQDKDRLEDLKRQRTPLFSLIVYRNDKLPEGLKDKFESNDFPKREVLKAFGDLTFVFALADYDEHAVGEAFRVDYDSLYEGIETIYNSLTFFEPESYETTVKERGTFDFTTQDLQHKEFKSQDLLKDKLTLVLFWNDKVPVGRMAYVELNSDVQKNELGDVAVQSILLNRKTDSLTEEDRAILLQDFKPDKVAVSVYLNDPTMEEGLTRYITRSPLYLLVDQKGNIVALHSGYLKIDGIKELVEQAR